MTPPSVPPPTRLPSWPRTRARTRPWPAMLLLAYPPSWRARYGDEVEVLVRDLHEHGRQPAAMAFDLIRGAVAAWCRTRRGSAMSERSRHALITVLWSWVAFAATAAWFGHDLGIYPNRGAARQIALAHPVVPDAFHVLYAVGIVGVAATVVAAVPFAIEAARYARANRANRTFALMAVPPVTAAVWLGGVRLLGHGSDSTARMTIAVIWLLLGLAGIAASTQAVARIVTTTEFAERTWRIGAGAAAAVAAAMLVGTGATIVWGLAYRASQGGASRAQGWLAVTAILAVTTGRAVIALAGSRRAAASAEPAVA
ncbi:MAG TPA: hypothetical protein VEM58_09980 [Streptosporangiaceae bacterium]|nr:hypothetical protein [Streptosporangiaceae bacterium]